MHESRKLALCHFWVAFGVFLPAVVLGVWQMLMRSPLPAPLDDPGTYYASVTLHGTAMAYLCDNLVSATPSWWAIWGEQIWFDAAFAQSLNLQLQYFQSLPLLSATNQTNFLTNRYPQLMRAACMTSAADFMKDDTEYQKGLTKLGALIAVIGGENDMLYRGAEIDAETP